MSATPKRSRRRSIVKQAPIVVTAEDKVNLEQEVKEKAIKYLELKEEVKALGKTLSSLAKDIQEYVDKAGVNDAEFAYIDDGTKKYIAAYYNEVAANKIDKELLIETIGAEDYSSISTCTQKAVTDNFGGKTLEKCLIIGTSKRFVIERSK